LITISFVEKSVLIVYVGLCCSEEFEREGLEASDLRFEELWFIYGHRALFQAASPSGSLKALFVSLEDRFPIN
jgi:hypothetical protein